MPHGHSWFDVLLGTFYSNAEHAAMALSAPVNEDGVTWLMSEDISVQHVFAAIFVLLIIIVFALVTNARIKNTEDAIVPEDSLTIASFVELITQATYGSMSEMMGPKAARFFLPLIGTAGFIILLSNFLGLIPGFLPPTGSLNTTLALAAVIFLATHGFGVKEHGIGYFKHFLGPVWWLAPLLLVIEIISELVRPASLSIRLMANMFADHQVVTEVGNLVAWVVPVFPLMLGSLVCVVQALVFCILSTVYISMAIAHDH
jgi:F-type H+-transporting ATPase subunit a